MTFLGYDPLALTQLAATLRRAADELADLAGIAGLGDHALRRRHVMASADTVAAWASRVRAVATCDVMERQHPVMLDTATTHLTGLQHVVAQQWQADGLSVVHMPDAPDLHGAALGAAAVDVLHRWAQGPWWVTAGHTPLNTADHVLAALVGDADALAVLWEHRHTTLGPVLYGPNDADRVRAVLLHWTRPDEVDMPTAADRVVPLLHYVRSIPHATAPELDGLRRRLVLNPGFGEAHETRWWTLRHAMAEVVAPWQVWMTTGHEQWGGSSGEALDSLRWLLESPGAATAVAHDLGASVASRADHLGDDPVSRRHTIDRLAWSIGAVDALVEHADRAHEASGEAGLDLLRGLVALSVGHAAGAAAAAATAVVAPPLAGVARTVSSGRVTQALDGENPSDVDQRRERARLASMDRRSVAAAGLMAVVVADHRRRGWLSAEVPDPPGPAPRHLDDPGAPEPLAEWLAHIDTLDGDHVHEAARRELHQVWHAVTPASERAAVDRGRTDVIG